MRLRQEVINVELARLLQDRGLAAVPEQIIRGAASQSTRLPDVIIDLQGLRVAIEGEYATTAQAQQRATQKARERVEEGIAHMGIGVVYPSGLEQTAHARLKSELSRAILSFSIVTELPDEPPVYQGNADSLAEALRQVYEELSQDDAVSRAVAVLEAGIERFASSVATQRGSVGRLAATLGVRAKGEALPVRQQAAVRRIAALIIANAMIFQEMLAECDERVLPLARLREEPVLIVVLGDHWRQIIEEINYYPIFHLACDLLGGLTANADVNRALDGMIGDALCIVRWRAALRHDLMGRVYHRLLEEAKPLGAFYTSIPAATLLLKLALEREAWDLEWQDPASLREFRIADLACGTGTLLVAAAEATADNYIRACVAEGVPPDMNAVWPGLIEETIWGFDVLPSALHLTASTLNLRAPQSPINSTNLFCLRLGGPEKRLGSLEFLEWDVITQNLALFGGEHGPQRITGQGERTVGVRLPKLDLCVMNPPFTRSVGGNLLFGNLPEPERAAMQTRLKRIVRRKGLQASITAGLGSVFVALGDEKLKDDGTLALVLPRALVSGVAWGKTRDLLTSRYALDYLIVSHEPGHWNFSENTKLSEVLVVARRATNAKSRNAPVKCVNLWRNPRSPIEALALARGIQESQPEEITRGEGSCTVTAGGRAVGAVVSCQAAFMRDQPWFGCAFAQTDLVRSLVYMLQGRLHLPGRGLCGDLPVVPLRGIGELGPDRRDIHDGFSVSDTRTVYPALWGHAADEVLQMAQRPNRYLQALTQAQEGRHLRGASVLWKRAGHLLIAERLRFTTMRLSAVLCEEPVLSNVWWPFACTSGDVRVAKALALWLNSTAGLTVLFGEREETEGPWVDFKKPTLFNMPVLNVAALGEDQLGHLAQVFDRVGSQTILPFPQMAEDPVRATLDEALAEVLDLPDLTVLREMLSREPVVCGTLDRLMSRSGST